MTVGVGHPTLLDDYRNVQVIEAQATEFIRGILEDEMNYVRENIERHQVVGPYVPNCQRWQHHLEVYEKMIDLLEMVAPKLVQQRSWSPKRQFA